MRNGGDYHRAFARLNGMHGVDASLLAGSVALEVARDAQDEAVALAALRQARASFNSCITYANRGRLPVGHPTVAVLKVHLTYMPLEADAVLRKRLPSREAARHAYKRTVKQGRRLLEGGYQTEPAAEAGLRRNLVSRIGVLALLGRHAIATDVTEQEYPFMACGLQANVGGEQHWGLVWHTSVLAKMHDGTIEPTHRIHTRARRFPEGSQQEYAPGITELCAWPDLRLDQDPDAQTWVHMINEMTEEVCSPAQQGNLQVSDNLDARTEQLLSIL